MFLEALLISEGREVNQKMADEPTEAVEKSSGMVVAVGERRKHRRHAVMAVAEARELQSGTLSKGRITDLSLGGCYIDTTAPFAVATTVKLRITSDKKTFESKAAVVNTQNGMGMGLLFTATEPEQLQVLERWLGELSGELPAEFDQMPYDEQAPVESLPQGQHYVLSELIIALMRKRVLTEAEGKLMLLNLLG